MQRINFIICVIVLTQFYYYKITKDKFMSSVMIFSTYCLTYNVLTSLEFFFLSIYYYIAEQLSRPNGFSNGCVLRSTGNVAHVCIDIQYNRRAHLVQSYTETLSRVGTGRVTGRAITHTAYRYSTS